MSTWLWIVIVVLAVLVIGAIAAAASRRRRTSQLQAGFGPEYDRTLDRTGDRAEAEADLRDRQSRHDELELHPLDGTTRARYLDEWQSTQAIFVDDPQSAITHADGLIQRVMRDRGYPVDDFEDRAAIVSVDHPVVVEQYRRAHAIAVVSGEGRAETEDLRQAMQDYRALFNELVETTEVR
jgi:hypothetical protein